MIGCVIGVVVFWLIQDVTQKKHTVLRNYPVLEEDRLPTPSLIIGEGYCLHRRRGNRAETHARHIDDRFAFERKAAITFADDEGWRRQTVFFQHRVVAQYRVFFCVTSWMNQNTTTPITQPIIVPKPYEITPMMPVISSPYRVESILMVTAQ